MSKIRAYYCLRTVARALINSVAFQNYSSNDPDFWLSNYRSATHILILLNGDDRDHTMFAAQAGINTIDFYDIRASLNDQKDSAFITKAVNHIDGLDFSDFDNAITVKGMVEVIIQHLHPGHCPLSFDNPPRASGTFTDDFTGTNGDFLETRTGWTLQLDGDYSGQIHTNALVIAQNGGGVGASYWTCTEQAANQYIQVTEMVTSSNYGDIYATVRLVDEENFIAHHVAGTGAAGARLCKMVSGSLTDSIVTTSGGLGIVFKIECEGTAIRYFKNGSQVGTDQTITDFQTETSAGIVAYENTGISTQKYDDWENGTIGGGETLLPISLNDQVISFVGKKINRGSVDLSAGSTLISNSGNEGKNSLADIVNESLLVESVGNEGKNSLVDIINESLLIEAIGKEGKNSQYTLNQDPIQINTFGKKGQIGSLNIDLNVVVSILGLEQQVIFTGILNSSISDLLLSSSGSKSANGQLSIQIENFINIFNGLKGNSSTVGINILTQTELFAKIGATGHIQTIISDLDVRMIEIVISEKIFQILISTKTGQISILEPKTGQINILEPKIGQINITTE